MVNSELINRPLHATRGVYNVAGAIRQRTACTDDKPTKLGNGRHDVGVEATKYSHHR